MLTPPHSQTSYGCAENQMRRLSRFQQLLSLVCVVFKIVSLCHLFSTRRANFCRVADQERPPPITRCIAVWVSPSVKFKASAHIREGTKLLTAGDISFPFFFSLRFDSPHSFLNPALLSSRHSLTGPRCRNPLPMHAGMYGKHSFLECGW